MNTAIDSNGNLKTKRTYTLYRYQSYPTVGYRGSNTPQLKEIFVSSLQNRKFSCVLLEKDNAAFLLHNVSTADL